MESNICVMKVAVLTPGWQVLTCLFLSIILYNCPVGHSLYCIELPFLYSIQPGVKREDTEGGSSTIMMKCTKPAL